MLRVATLCLAIVTVTACGNGGTTDAGDGAVGIDGDAMRPDVIGTDGDSAPPGDGGYDPCAAPIDIITAGTLTGSTLDYTGSTALVPPGAPIPDTACTSTVGFELALAYTTRTACVLQASLANPGTDVMFDTVMWVMDACNATGMNEIGCDDDSSDRRSSLTTTSLAAGVTVYIIVAGDSPPTDSTYTDHGPFELTVTEVPTVPLGAACDPSGTTSVCVTGTSCATVGTTSTCVADGALGGACLMSTPACNAGLGCSGMNTCVPAIATGAACDPTFTANVCVAGSSCVTVGTSSTCVADGTLGGVCRTTSMACDAGLGCNGSFMCVPAIALGGACDPTDTANVCASGLGCVTRGTTSTCHGAVPTALAAPVFVDACAAGTDVTSMLTDTDEGHTSSAIAIPFTYAFLGGSYTQIWPDTNGWAQFGPDAPSVDFLGGIPDGIEGAFVAPFAEDLVVTSSGTPTAAICWLTTGTAPARQFVVEWRNVQASAADDTSLTFEVVLYENSANVDFIYQTLTPSSGGDENLADGTFASIGLQDGTAMDTGVYMSTVASGQGIRFTPM